MSRSLIITPPVPSTVEAKNTTTKKIMSTLQDGELKRKEYIRLFVLSVKNKWGCLPILARADTKQPVHKHASPHDYDSKAAQLVAEMDGTPAQQAHWNREMSRYSLNLLLDELYVIDCDSPEAFQWVQDELIRRFPAEFEDCPMQQTRKGMHFIFLRPPGCDHYFSSRAVTLPDGTKPEIDICTVTSTGTRGNLNVHPSPNKQWVRSIHDYPPKVLSAELYTYLDSIFTGKRMSNAVIKPAPRHRVASQVREAQPDGSVTVRTVVASPNTELTPRQQLYTNFVIQRSMVEQRESVCRSQIVWTSENSARVYAQGSPLSVKDNEGVLRGAVRRTEIMSQMAIMP